MTPKCALEGVGKTFGPHQAVQGIDLAIAPGEFVVFLGPSGCGKTTTLRMIAGLERPDSGTIAIDGRIVSGPGQFVRPEQRAIGMVFQSYAIWPHMTVAENVAYPLRVRRTPAPERTRRTEDALALVGLEGAGPRPATALSGGQMQRVALARALVADPALLLFDEPLSNLDLKLRERLRDELKSLQRRTGLTSIYVTHDQTEAVELADRIVVMRAGRIEQIGAPRDLYNAPRTRFVAEFIAAANILPATIVAPGGPGVSRIRMESGFELDARHEPDLAGPADLVLHPEDCTLYPPGAVLDGPATPVTIRAIRFQGTATRYTVAMAATLFDVLVLGTDDPLPEGAPALLRIAPGRARLVPRA